MELVLVASLVTALAFVGARFGVLRLPLARLGGRPGVRNILLTGTEYLLVGLLLGDEVLDVLDVEALAGLAPLLGLGLSWIGLLFGIQWQVRRLDGVARAGLTPALVQAGITLAVVAVPFHFLLGPWFGADGPLVLVCALSLGAAASDTAQSALARQVRGDQPLVRLLRLVADVDGLVAVAVFGAVCWLPVLHGGTGSVWLWAGLSGGLGLAIGGVAVALSASRLAEDERLVILLGTVLTGGGIALYLSLSPLFVNAVAGAVIANLAGERTLRSLRNLLMRGDRAIYVLFLILAGAQWHPEGWSILGFALLYLGLRTAGKLAGGWLAFRRRLRTDGARPGVAPRLGLGLLSHGGLAVAVVVNLQQLAGRAPIVDAVATMVLLGVVVSELVSPAAVQRLLRADAAPTGSPTASPPGNPPVSETPT